MTKQPERQNEALSLNQETHTNGTAAFADNRLGIIQQKKLLQSITQSNRNRTGNTTGLPGKLKTGIENLSGYSMNDVQVHYNSGKPPQLGAHAYTQGSAIYLAPGQQKHLPHEAWHVVQQKQGRVQPNLQLKGKVPANDDAGLEKEADSMGAKAAHIGGTEGIHTTAPVGKTMLPAATAPVQGKFYFGEEELNRKTLGQELLNHLQYYVKAKELKRVTKELEKKLWGKYGKSDELHMEMGAVIKIAKRQGTIELKDVDRFMQELAGVDARDINTPEQFERRIMGDTRIDEEMQKQYIVAFKYRKDNPAPYEKIKVQVKTARQQKIKYNKKEADEDLKSGGYYMQNQKEKDFRTYVNEGAVHYGIETLANIYLLNLNATMTRMQAKVLDMKHELMGAFYYHSDAHNEIFDSNELKSLTLRGDTGPKKSHKVDVANYKTGSYVFFFIEHKRSAYNTNSRFNAPATTDGLIFQHDINSTKKNAGGQRVRYPLAKLVKHGAIALGGDISVDRPEEKLGIERNKTPNKIFGSGGATDDLEGFLKNYCGFVKSRIKQVLEFKKGTTIKEGEKKREKANEVLKRIDELEGPDLWDYLIRHVARPQLMVPIMVSLSMKEQEVDFQPPIHFLKKSYEAKPGEGIFDVLSSKLNLKEQDVALMAFLEEDNPDEYKKIMDDVEWVLLKGNDRIQNAIDNGRFMLATGKKEHQRWITYIKTKPGKWWDCRMDEQPELIGEDKDVKTRIKEFGKFELYLAYIKKADKPKPPPVIELPVIASSDMK